MPAASVHTAVHEPAYSRVRINLSGFATGTTSVQVIRRNLATSQVSLVRGARAIVIGDPAADSVQLYDYEFPAGAQVQYGYFQFPDLVRYDVAAATAYDVAGVWVKHLLRPYLSRLVRVGQFTPAQHMLRAGTSPVTRRSVPIGGGDVRSGRRWQLSVKLEPAERDSWDTLLRVGGIWLWQPPSTDAGLPRQCYVQAFSAQERLRGRPQDGARWVDLVLDEVAPPDADLAAAAVTWSAIIAAQPTWDDVLATYPTWDDVLASVAVPSEVTVP